MSYDARRALELVRLGTRIPDVQFRQGQEQSIRHIVEGRGRLLVVQKTGWGKSFVYFIAAKLLRETGLGPSLLISPLLALMRNQILAAERMGVRAKTIHSDNRDEWSEVEGLIRGDQVDILLISPERLANERFRGEVLAEIAGRIALLVIDEAHCISDWGHDFRPHYRLIERIVRTLPASLRLLATTATANNRVMDDLTDVLGPDLEVSRGDLGRPSLMLQTIRLRSQAERLAWLAEHVPAIPGHGIIYTLTVRDADQVAAWLRSRGIEVESYTSDTGDRREELEQSLLENRVKALVATTALGMGFDKPDLGFVIHYQTPGSAVAYYQQVGRAGRAVDAAYGVLLSGDEETDITDYFIEHAFPTHDEVRIVLDALERSPQGLSVPELLGTVNVGSFPAWVTCVPSKRHPGLVPDFARRLALALGLPFEPTMVRTHDRPEQKTMANSFQQARNLDGALAIVAQNVRSEPVILVDDMVDSRWTLTVAAWLLRSHGSGEVWPLALSQAGARQ